MIKVVVLDVTGNEATVMTDDGDIIGIRNRGYDIGQEINIKKTAGTLAGNLYRLIPAVAAAAVAIVLVAGIKVYATPYGTVSLDVNPSIEYTINRFDRVLNVSGVNEDGSNILAQMDPKALLNKDIEDAVELTIEQIEADGYMEDEDGNYIVLAANTERENHTDKVLERLDDKVGGHGNIKHMSFKVTKDELENAHEQGISPGKKKIVDRLDEMSEDAIDRSEWNNKSVKDIVREYDRVNEGSVKSQDTLKQTDQMDNKPSEATTGGDKINEQKEEITKPDKPAEENRQEEKSPAQDRTEDFRPAENKPTEERPEEKRQEVNRPEENRQEQNHPEEDRPEENRSEENHPDENRSEENRPKEENRDDPGNRPEEPPAGHDNERGHDPNF